MSEKYPSWEASRWKLLRLFLGFTQGHMAERCGVSQKMVSMLETAEHDNDPCTLSTAFEILAVLNLTMDSVFPKTFDDHGRLIKLPLSKRELEICELDLRKIPPSERERVLREKFASPDVHKPTFIPSEIRDRFTENKPQQLTALGVQADA